MTCAEISALVPLYLSGELDSSRASGFAAHLENCPACAREVRNHTVFDADLRTCLLADTIGTGALERRVLQRIALEGKRRRIIFAAAAFAAIALVILPGYRAIFHPIAPGVYEAAARDHHFEIVDRQPRRWRTDVASVQELAQGQGIAASAVSALAPAGYRLEQGKLCRLDGRLFLHLVYKDGAKIFSIFLRQEGDKTTAEKRIYASNAGAEHVAGFQAGTLRAMVVTNEPGDTAVLLARFAATII